MFRKGLAVAVILLFIGVALTPTTYGDFDKPDIEAIEEDVTPTPIVLVLQLITKLRNHKDIQNVETEDDVLQIIEEDEELNSIYEQLSGNDCGCEDDSSAFTWRYPVLCTFLYPLWIIAVGILFAFHIWQFFDTMAAIGIKLDCYWA